MSVRSHSHIRLTREQGGAAARPRPLLVTGEPSSSRANPGACRREALPGAQALRACTCVSCPDGAPDPSSELSWVAGTGFEMW